MPVVRAGMRKPPPGFDTIAEKLDAYDEEMKQAVQDDSKGVVGQTTKPKGTRKRPRDPDEGQPSGESKDAEADAEPDGNGSTNRELEDGETNKPNAVPPLWRVAQINEARTRFVFNACFRERSISKEVFDYCCEMNFIDAGLARRWRLPGYEHLCCTACGVPGAASMAANTTSKFALRDRQGRKGKGVGEAVHDRSTCICRVPAAQRKNKSFLACTVCGCHGCCSADVSAAASRE